VNVAYDGSKYHADILACMGPMPTKEVWIEKGYSDYGLIAMGKTGEGAQVEKVDFDTATKLLSGLGEVTSVGPSLGSFSISSELLSCLTTEYAPELAAKETAFDSDPHFWMPMTLAKEDYIKIMLTKKMTEEDAGAHFERMAAMSAKLSTDKGKFGAVNVGARSSVYWWDYGQVGTRYARIHTHAHTHAHTHTHAHAHTPQLHSTHTSDSPTHPPHSRVKVVYYIDNNILMTNTDQEAAALRMFLGFGEDGTMGSTIGEGCTVDANSAVSLLDAEFSDAFVACGARCIRGMRCLY
jgi:hypothetical protein